MRFLSGRAVALSRVFYDDDDVLSVPSVSVTVWPEASSSPVYTGEATQHGDEWRVGAGTLPIGVYRAEWDAGDFVETDYFEVTGAVLFTVKQARDSDSDLTPTKFSGADIRRCRDEVEAEFEQITGRSFTPRSRTVTVYGDGSSSVVLGVFDVIALTALTVDGEGESELSDWEITPSGILEGPCSIRDGAKVVATVTYGFKSPPPDVRRAGLIRLRSLVTQPNSRMQDRAVSMITPEGEQYTLATAGRGGSETGIPDVDAVLKRYRYDLLMSTVGVG